MISTKPFYSKRFGQHFLHNQSTIKRIIQLIDLQTNDVVVEIGPGGAALTKHLLPQVNWLTAIEIDKNWYHFLQENLGDHYPQLHLYHADVLEFDFASIQYPELSRIRLVGNLAYNIATPLLFRLINYRNIFYDWNVMLQKEVVDRLVASPGSRIYGRLSVMMQYYCKIKRLLTVPAGAFTPPPKVNSAFITLQPLHPLPYQAMNEVLFAQIVQAAFHQRRKMITNSLSRFNMTVDLFESCDINPKARAETLSVADYVRITNTLVKTLPETQNSMQ